LNGCRRLVERRLFRRRHDERRQRLGCLKKYKRGRWRRHGRDRLGGFDDIVRIGRRSIAEEHVDRSPPTGNITVGH
jgi:hypothetical protein